MTERDARRVVVTGMGILSPVGNTLDAAWEALLAGRSGTGPITRFDAEGFASRIAGEVHGFDPRDRLEPKEARRTDRFIQLAVAATQDALAHAELEITPENARFVASPVPVPTLKLRPVVPLSVIEPLVAVSVTWTEADPASRSAMLI